MLRREIIRRLEHSEEFSEPHTGQNVWPRQWCPAFTERHSTIPFVPKCWFCRCAYFGLENKTALEVGICRYPEVQTR